MPIKSQTEIVSDEKLIEAVRNRPLLWNKELKEYKESNKHDRDSKWKEIGDIVGLTGSKSMDKFRGLRNNFNQIYRRITENVPSGSAAPETPKTTNWPHYNSMLFLKDTIKNSISESNLEDNCVFDGIGGASKQQDLNDFALIPVVDDSQQVNVSDGYEAPIDGIDDFSISTNSSSAGTSSTFAPLDVSTPGPSRTLQRLNNSFNLNQSVCIRSNGKRSKDSLYSAELRAQEQTNDLIGELLKRPKKSMSASGKILMSFEDDLNNVAEPEDRARFRLIFSKLFLGYFREGKTYLDNVEAYLN